MTIILLLVHVAVCLVLILVVLLQTGKRADLAGAFGGGGSQTAFGARGAATFLSKATTYSAIIFMATSVLLGIWFGRETSESVVEEPSGPSAPAAAPAKPATTPGQPTGQPEAPVPSGSPSGSPETPAAPPAQPPGSTK